MSKFEVLNSVSHLNLRVVNQCANTALEAVLPNEIPFLQREFPLVFRRHEATGVIAPHVMLGLEPDESLFIGKDGVWQSRYVPFALGRGPFLMGPAQGEDGKQSSVLCIDIEDERVGSADGERVFDQLGEVTPFTSEKVSVLRAIKEGEVYAKDFMQEIEGAGLLEELSLDCRLKNGRVLRLDGAYTISPEKLHSLESEVVNSLHAKGYLSLAYFIVNSLDNVQNLIDIKNIRS